MRAKTFKKEFIVFFILVVNCFISFNLVENAMADTPPTFYVDLTYDNSTPGWGDDHFNSIQKALDNASAGDRIIVYNGEYHERIVINESIDLFGEDAEKTIINGEINSQTNGSVVTINATNVDLSTFTIKNSGSEETDAGVKVNASNCKIIDNIISNCNNGVFIRNYDEATIAYNSITNNAYGIFLSLSSSDNTINYNNIYSNSYDGIFLNKTCNDNSITGNEIYNNPTGNGIYLHEHCNNSYISDNNIYNNGLIGIRIENSSNNQIVNGNTVKLHSSYYGIMIVGNNNRIENSIIQDNKHGIFLLADNDTIIYNNMIIENDLDGIRLQNSTGNTIYTNRITDNSRYGIYINYFSINNVIYNNYFGDNTYNARDISNYNNFWNISSIGTNIIGGSKMGGNFWDDYSGTDSNNDGIGETTYSISPVPPGNKIDYLPLVTRLPTADAGGPYNVYLGTTITFDGSDSLCPDGHITNYSWDFGDGTERYEQKPSHKYTSTGEYEVILTVTNSYDKTDTGNTTATIIGDTEPPTITIKEHGPSFNEIPNSFTFLVVAKDNVKVASVYIEYWYGSSGKMTADMENTAGSYYQKVIIPTSTTDIVHCVIYANDTTGNKADTKNPYSDPGGPYTGYVTQTITFNGTGSYDLDGNISSYEWDFGDGNNGTVETPTHKYSTKGNYTVTLTITDNEGNTNTVSTTITIKSLIKITASTHTINGLETEFNITLNEQFWGYDTDGDGKAETFADPNGIIEVLHMGYVSINSHASFLLAVNGDLNKIFIWDAETDSIINVTYQTGTVVDPEGELELEAGTITLTVNTDKAAWTFIEITDHHQGISGLSITRSDGSSISADMFWRKNNKIYLLDDPDTTYYLIYSSSAILQDAVFSPNVGSTINAENPTITISYNIPVDIIKAEFVRLDPKTYLPISSTYMDIILDLDTNDFKIYYYTPPENLENGIYSIIIKARDNNGNEIENSMNYNYESYAIEEMGFPTTTLLMLFGGIIAFGAVVYFILKHKKIALESFIYIKNRRIIPFFKPVVIGPLKINLDDKKISKAEFYVNGTLKETIDEAPYSWTWNETAFMKQKIETKIFDENGKSSSSGKMTFYMFNPTKPNK